MMKRIYIGLLSSAVLAGFVFFLRCGNVVNPYIDPANAGIEIEKTSTIHNNDTINIFSTKKLVLGVKLPRYIDSIRVNIPFNRFWSGADTVIRNKEITASELTIPLSIYDTGNSRIKLITYRSGMAPVQDSLAFRARSPLSQKTVQGGLGDTVNLETAPVDDAVLYIWDFKDFQVINYSRPDTDYVIKTKLTSKIGELYVSDQTYSSPHVRFDILSTDTQRTISFATGTSSVKEPGLVNIGIALSAPFTMPVICSLTVDSISSTVDKNDFFFPTGTSITVFTASDTFKTVTIAILDDSIAEPAETLSLVLVPISGELTLGAQKKHTVLISDNDAALDVTVYPDKSGTVVRRVNGIEYNGPYSYGTKVEVHAQADSGYKFGYYSGAQNTESNPITITMDSSMSLRATFIRSDQPDPGILWELWSGIEGDSVVNLTSWGLYPDNPSERRKIVPPYFSTTPHVVENYGQRLRAFIFPPQTGIYTFWISSDDQSELWLGKSDSASSAVKIANVPEKTQKEEWQKFSSQQSAQITLSAGKKYYIEALHKQGTGTAHLSVAWRLPDGTDERPIPTFRLAPYETPNSPNIIKDPDSLTVIAGQTATFSIEAGGTGPLDYQWQKNDAAIAGAVDTAYTTPATIPEDNSSTFRCIVSNPFGKKESKRAKLTVQYKPIITTQPQPQTVNIGQPVSFNLKAKGNPAPTYQWKKNQSDIQGATSDIYSITQVSLADTGNYYAAVFNAIDSVSTDTVRLNVTPVGSPTITSQPKSDTVNVGDPVSFSVTASGNPVLAYQWSKNNDTIPGATKNVYTIVSAAMNDTGIYTVKVTNTVGSITSNPARLTVILLSAPAITVQPVSHSVNAGQADTFRVFATGNPTPTYQWKKNGVTIAGTTKNIYPIASVSVSDSGNYTVDVMNKLDTVTSNQAHLTVNQFFAPVITTQPVSQSVNAGQSVSFSVIATGNPSPTYQWRKNGINISNATGKTYTIGSAAMSDTGNYTVFVSNSQGSVISNPAHLTVTPLTAPVITKQPVSQTVNTSQSVTFSVTATGSPPLSYQWKKDGAAITGATSASYTIPSASLTDSGNYTVVVGNSVNSVTSNSAHLTVIQVIAPVITVQPVSQSVNAGQSVSFSVTATGNPAPTYQWRKNGTPISGATASTYTISSVSASDSGSYTVRVTNTGGNVTSNPAHLTVFTAPVITAQPTSKTINAGQSVSFSVTAIGNPAPTYQWNKNGAPISGATASTYTIASAVVSDSGNYTVTVTNQVNTVTSNQAHLAVIPLSAPVITTQPVSKSVNAGQSVSFSVTATGNPAPTYQWRKDGTPIPGATGSTYSIASTSVSDSGNYTVEVMNPVDTIMSNQAHLTVNVSAPVITAQPVSKSVNAGQSVSFSVTAIGIPAPTYQWKKDGTLITGATGSSHTIASASVSDTGNYTVDVMNLVDTVTSNQAHLTVIPLSLPVITQQPVSQTVNAGQSVTFSVTATGNPTPYYQWKKNGTTITGATGSTYPIASTSLSDSGNYTVDVSNTQGTVPSNQAHLTVLAIPPVITVQPVSQSVNEGESVSFSVTATGNPAPTYQWKKGGLPITGATARTYSITSALVSDSGNYAVDVMNPGDTVTSNQAHLTVIPAAPVITVQPVSQIVNAGQSVSFSVTATGNPTPSYQWRKDGTPISGATASTYTIASVSVSDAGNYTVVVTNFLGSVASSPASLNVRYAPAITTHPASQTVSTAAPVTFSVVAAGNPAPEYQWYKDDILISGATNASYTLPSVVAGDAGSYKVKVSNIVGEVTSNAAVLTVQHASAPLGTAAPPEYHRELR